MIEYNSISAIVNEADRRGVSVSQLVLEDQAADMGAPQETVLGRMTEMLGVMRSAAEEGLARAERSATGLSGGDGARMRAYADAGPQSGGGPLGGAFCARATAIAIAIAEYNASMGKIVAAPTAGSCGIVPAAILTMMDMRGVSERAAAMALITAGAFGMVIAKEATIAGAQGGCMAECGSAAAMAAGALVELSGGANEAAAHAFAIAIKNQLGLVCDPVAGLVEVPCVKRNAGGIVCAIGAADMALAGIRSVIPVDEVVSAMREVGDSIPPALRETAQGGLAATPTGLAIKDRIFGK